VAPRAALVRLVADENGAILVDKRGKLPGRGVWILPTAATLTLAESRPGVLAKALDIPKCTTNGLKEQIRALLLERVLDLLSLAARAGLIASGEYQLAAATSPSAQTTPPALLAALDASPQTVASARARCPDAIFLTLPLDKEQLGHRIGKGPRAVIALRPGSVTSSLLQQLPRLEELR
jgi:predicted RNA-binding protein YlxR (DUF448 family)